MNLQPRRIERALDHFSGGNQQKVLLAKSLTRAVDMFAFDEPTVGVDVGTRASIYGFIRDLCEAGAAVVLISSDLPEILHLNHRAYVFYRGRDPDRARRPATSPRKTCCATSSRGRPPDEFRGRPRVTAPRRRPTGCKVVFVRLGVLPFLLIVALIVFTLASDNFLTVSNLTNVVRQSVYLMIVALGQMLALLTGGFDLSVGTIVAITSVVGAMAMAAASAAMPDTVWLAITHRLPRRCGGRNQRRRPQRHRRVGVRRVALHHDARHLVGRRRRRALHHRRRPGLWHADRVRRHFRFRHRSRHPGADLFRRWHWPSCVYLIVNRTRLGRYFYAVGGNVKAARLSGINTRLTLFVDLRAVRLPCRRLRACC